MAMKTPGVYVVEKSAFPNSVVQVATAVPAFIGYTETAMNGNLSLAGVPKRLTSMMEFHSFFGGAPSPQFRIQPFAERAGTSPLSIAGAAMAPEMPQAVFTVKGPRGPEKHELVQVNPAYALYGAMRLFFQNGGGACYVTSIGSYDDGIAAQPMLDALDRLRKEPEPTMVVIPDATRLPHMEAIMVQQQMLKHCGTDMKNRFAILDVPGGHLAQDGPRGRPVARFRDALGTTNLNYGAAYYPWLNTSVYAGKDFDFLNIAFESRKKLISMLRRSVSQDPAVVPEIERLGTPVLSGDFTLSVVPGQTIVVTPTDIAARDESTAENVLRFRVEGDAAKMAGRLIRTGTDEPATEFTQDELKQGKISFRHDPEGGAAGQGEFEVVVIDGDDVETAARKIRVVTGSKVLAKGAAGKGSTAVIDVTAGVEGAEAGTVVLEGADELDEEAVIEADPEASKAKAEAEADGATKAARDKAAAAAEKAIAAVRGKTLTVKDVGVWTVQEAGTITFAPDLAFAGDAASALYTMSVKGEVVGPQEVRVLLDGVAEKAPADDPSAEFVDKTMRAVAPLYVEIMDTIAAYMNVMAPSAAMAGLYTMVDNARGVWKAPANVSIASVVSPTVNIDHDEQADLNVSTTGKSINAIRPFTGEGTLVWGARTLDGNSLDWRYVNVRRTMIMIEESIRLASKAYVFEPNTANTWVTIRSMIENFLTSVWKQGGLAGAVPADAFSVHVGLGETMTPVDILEGILRITVLVAVVRPAEFIEITFQQQMQKS
jgi:phage tail sheath protein FI